MKKLTRRLIIFLVRKRLGLTKNQVFQFTNQRNLDDQYVFWKDQLVKISLDEIRPANVSLYWLLNDNCEIDTYYTMDRWFFNYLKSRRNCTIEL